MIARYIPSPSTSRAAQALRDARGPALGDVAAVALPLAVGLFGTLAFLPYVAAPVGNRSAVQLGDMLALLLAAPAAFVAWRRQPFWMAPLLLTPLCVATLWVALTGADDVSLCFKTTIVLALPLLTLVVTQLYAPRYALELLTGIAIATLLHAAVGLWQWHAFNSGYFPFVWLYENQSFLSVKEHADTIARYIRRPFGVFPEPSAMSASLAPFVLLWTAEMCGLVRLRRTPAPWQRALFAAAAAGGLGLMILSRSGHAAVTTLAVVSFAAAWFVRSRGTSRTYLIILGVFGVVLPVVLVAAAAALANRLGGATMGNSSWEDRTNSLLIGFSLMARGGIGSLVFGLGPGLSAPALWRIAQLDAVWSVLLTYLYETGLLGLAAVACVGHHLAGTWKRSGCAWVFAAIFGVWLVGITVTTSYPQLLPLWVALAWLTVWPDVCEPTNRPASGTINRSFARVRQPRSREVAA